jgi:hypothetical protein
MRISHFGGDAEGRGSSTRQWRYGSMNWMRAGFVVGSMVAAGALLQQDGGDAGALFVLIGAPCWPF